MRYPKPQAGQSLDFIKKAQVWADIFEMLNAWKSGQFTGRRGNQATEERSISIVNSTGSDRAIYEVMQVDRIEVGDMPASAVKDAFHAYPTLKAVNPVWNVKMDNLTIVPGVATNGIFAWQPRTWGTVAVTVVESTDTHVMLDPGSLNKMRTSDTGPWKILALDTVNNLATVSFSGGSNLWRYVLSSNSAAPDTTAAKLRRLDGDDFSTTTINLEDSLSLMEDQVIADEGFCIHVGNKFFAIQAPC